MFQASFSTAIFFRDQSQIRDRRQVAMQRTFRFNTGSLDHAWAQITHLDSTSMAEYAMISTEAGLTRQLFDYRSHSCPQPILFVSVDPELLDPTQNPARVLTVTDRRREIGPVRAYNV